MEIGQLVFSVTHTGQVKFASQFHWPLAVNKAYALQFVTAGKARLMMNGQQYRMEPGKLLVIHPTTSLEWITEMEPVEFYRIRYDFITTYKSREVWHFSQEVPISFPLLDSVYTIQNIPVVLDLFEKIHELSNKVDHLSALLCKNSFNQLIYAILDDFQIQQFAGDACGAIQTSIDYIHHHFNEKLSVPLLTRQFGLSESQYTKRFKEMTGYTPYEYIIRLRVNKAKELLEKSNQSISLIARMVGYEDVLYFSRMFKKMTGVPPSHYANENRM
jgi:AraC-like DNA-binding protein